MRRTNICLSGFFAVLLLFTSCHGYRKYLNEEVVLKDENSYTGTVIFSDTSKIKLKKIDESVMVIPWISIDTIGGKRLKCFFAGMNAGYYRIPYYSVFRNEAITSSAIGFQFKAGTTLRGDKLIYANLITSPATPYAINMYGVGIQRYIYKSSYIGDDAYFLGAEFDLMNAKNNNGAQANLQPFAGIEKKLSDQIRIHAKWALQFNFANKNTKTGVNFTIGIHFMRKNFNYRYAYLNKERKLYKR
jgi:hypothetical protein